MGSGIVVTFFVINIIIAFYEHTHTHTHTYIYIYICVCVSVCVCVCVYQCDTTCGSLLNWYVKIRIYEIYSN